MKKKIIRKILKLLTFGGIAALFSTIALGLILCAIWLFAYIPSATGYFAVLLFALALIATAATLYKSNTQPQ